MTTGKRPFDFLPMTEAIKAAESLLPEGGLMDMDAVGFGGALFELWSSYVRDPWPALTATLRYGTGLAGLVMTGAARALGSARPGPIEPAADDRRFTDPAWEQNPWFFGVKGRYLLWAELMLELVERANVDDATRNKARFATQAFIDALAPTNRLWSNPTALKRAFDTGGLSLARGLRNFASDVVTNHGRPRQVDASGFIMGENLGATPGQVVFRNDLMELIQYAPQTKTVHEVPILFSPPWINKFYIMDLSPGRSFVEWAVTHGHTVFAISYRNPDRSMSQVTLDDYLINGPLAALDVIEQITSNPRDDRPEINIAGLCLGGTLTTMLLAYLAAEGDYRVRSATLLNTLIDFEQPGMLGLFSDAGSVERLEKKMAKEGYLPATDLAGTFDLLRANDLIWNYVVNNWLMGERPPAFDILAWNADGTRMPAEMHSFYLRTCYLENQLARGEMELAGRSLDLGSVKADVYLLAAENDHIVPWTSSYSATQLLGGDVRFVLSSSGHIAGIVNPPNPKAKYWTGDELPAGPEQWRASSILHPGSWWEDWARWIGPRSGRRRKPPSMGSAAYPPLGPAPGSYVLER